MLKGMSREDDSVIFGTALAMGITSATGAERLSLGFQPVTKTGAALFLSPDRTSRIDVETSRAVVLGQSRPVRTVTSAGSKASR